MTGRISVMVVMLLLAAGAADSQTARTAPLMRDKLVHAQSLLEALTTSNFELLTRERGPHPHRRITALGGTQDPGAEAADGQLPEGSGRSGRGDKDAGPGCRSGTLQRISHQLLPVPQAAERYADRTLAG
jgi:hypothetical protein